jgi:hypothetical protein
MISRNCSRLTATSRPLPVHHLGYHKCLFNPLKPSGHYMYRQFNIQQLYALPAQWVFVCFVWIWEQTAIISLYSVNWLVFITEV